MIKEIVKDIEFLSIPAEVATEQDEQIAQDLVDTMESLGDNAACLAANQIGSNKAIIAYEENGRIHVMFNPKIIATMQSYEVEESCLSLDEPHVVKRFYTIRVSFDALVDGKLEHKTKKLNDFSAEIVQHAIDHCAGKLV